MTTKDSILLKRTVCAMVLTLLTGSMIAYSALHSGINYRPVEHKIPSLIHEEPGGTVTAVAEPEDSRQIMSLSFVGNCIAGSMLGSSAYGTFNEMVTLEGPEYFLEHAAADLTGDDWTVAALCSVFSDSAPDPADKSGGDRIWYLGPASNAEVLSSGGIDIVSLATDHTMDYGRNGYEDTKAALEKAGVTWGDDSKAVYLEKNGLRIGIYACTFTDADEDMTRVMDWIGGAAESCDLVIVYPHGQLGAEEPDDQAVMDAYCSMITAGADLVLASHADTVSGPETYRDGLIVPSLGSFLSGDTRFPEMDTMIFRLRLICTDDGLESWDWEILPYLAYEEPWQPVARPE